MGGAEVENEADKQKEQLEEENEIHYNQILTNLGFGRFYVGKFLGEHVN